MLTEKSGVLTRAQPMGRAMQSRAPHGLNVLAFRYMQYNTLFGTVHAHLATRIRRFSGQYMQVMRYFRAYQMLKAFRSENFLRADTPFKGYQINLI